MTGSRFRSRGSIIRSLKYGPPANEKNSPSRSSPHAVSLLAYCLSVTLKHRLQAHAPGLTPRAVLEKFVGIQMLDVSFPTADGRCPTMPRYTEPSRVSRLEIVPERELQVPRVA